MELLERAALKLSLHEPEEPFQLFDRHFRVGGGLYRRI